MADRILRFSRTLDMDTFSGRQGAADTAAIAIQWLGGFVPMMFAADRYSLGVPSEFDKRTKEAKAFEKAEAELIQAMKRYDNSLKELREATPRA